MKHFASRDNQNWPVWRWIGVAVIPAAMYLAAAWSLGYAGFPLDDAWIHQTYARKLRGDDRQKGPRPRVLRGGAAALALLLLILFWCWPALPWYRGAAALALLLLIPVTVWAYNSRQLESSPVSAFAQFMNLQASSAETPPRLLFSDQTTYRQVYPQLRGAFDLQLTDGPQKGFTGAATAADLLKNQSEVWVLPTGLQGQALLNTVASRGTALGAYNFEGLGEVSRYSFAANPLPDIPLARFIGGIELLDYSVNVQPDAAGRLHGNLALVWEIGDLQPGDVFTATWQGEVDAALPAKVTNILNTARLVSEGGLTAEAQGRSRVLHPVPELRLRAATLAGPGETLPYTLTLRNSAVLTAAAGVVQTAAVTTTLKQPALTLSKFGPPAAGPGQSVTWRLVVTNSGSAPARNVILTDTLPASVTLLAVENGGQASAGVFVKKRAVFTGHVRLDVYRLTVRGGVGKQGNQGVAGEAEETPAFITKISTPNCSRSLEKAIRPGLGP